MTTRPTTDEIGEFCKLAGMLLCVERQRAAFFDRLGDDKATDAYIHRIVLEAAMVYGDGREAGAAFWLPELTRQARELGLFADPFAITGSPSSASVRH